MHTPIYLDHNGTTPVDPEVLAAALPYLEQHFGNPSTKSAYGKNARAGLDRARSEVAELLGCDPSEVVFTGGASEANNFLVKGLAFAWEGPGRPHFVTSTVEHPSILQPLAFLERKGLAEVTRVDVDAQGRVAPESVKAALRPNTALITVMHANNEVGTVQPLPKLRLGTPPLHTDAAQSAGKLSVNVRELGVDFLTLAGHKMYAPKGVGALYVRSGLKLEPLIHGAGHEAGRRSGTENVAFVVALGAACRLALQRWREDARRMAAQRDRLWQTLAGQLGERVSRNGHPEACLPNTLSVNFLGVTGAELLGRCADLAASTGPACHDGVVRLSHVLEAMRVPLEVGKGAVRLSLGRHTTDEQIERAGRSLVEAYLAGVGDGVL
ncbi:MAG: cysteine desulfurase family protein [Candidatus Eremiobacterota bacterium]